MRKNRSWLLTIIVLSIVSYFLTRTPEYPYLAELPGFFNDDHHFIPLNIIEFSSGNIPVIQVQIENTNLQAKVDLGWEGSVVLPQAILHSITEKTFVKKKIFLGARGKSYESDLYKVPNIKIGELKMFSVWAEEQNNEFLKDGLINEEDSVQSELYFGRIGWHIFRPFNFFIDCNHSTIVMCDNLETIKNQGYCLDGFIETSLFLDRGTIDFELITEAGPLRCVLDTGSTWNVLNKDLDTPTQDHRCIHLDDFEENLQTINPKNENLLTFTFEDQWKSEKCQINGREFGPINFIKIKSPIDIDAIVGMEFIENHLIFIDFFNEKIYFSKLPDQRSLLSKAYDFISCCGD